MKWIMSLIFWTIAVMAWALPATHPSERSATINDLLFRAAFDGQVQADIARGVAKPKNIVGRLRFEQGHFGKALVAGEDGAAVAYRVENNLDVKQGSLSLWLLPVNWPPGEPRAHMLLQFTEASIFRLFTDQTGQLVFEVGTDLADRCRVAAPLGAYKQNEWLHIVATWSAQELCLYLNDQPAARAPCQDRFLPSVVNYNFQIGDLPHARGREEPRITLIDDMTIYRRPIGAGELQRVETTAGSTIKVDELPQITVAQRNQPIQVDGVIDADEWRQAATFSGFQDVSDHKLAPLQTVARLAYDDQKLYFAVESPVLPGVALRAECRNRDDQVATDDAIQLYLAPPGNLRYHLIVNSAGVIFDRKTIVGIDHDTTWDGKWQIVNCVTGGVWRLEGAIAFADLEVSAPAGGETWRINVTRDRVEPKSLSCWPRLNQYSDEDQHGVVRFVRSGPSLAVPLIGAIMGGKVAVDAHIEPSGVKLIANLRVAQSGTMVLEKTIPIDLPTLQLREPVEGALPDLAQFRVTDGGGLVYFQQTVSPGGAAGLRMDVLPIPSRGICKVMLREQDATVLAAKPQAMVQLLPESGSEAVRALHFNALENGSAGGEFDIADLPAGSYTLRATVMTGRQVLDEAVAAFVKPDEPWSGQHVGVSGTPPPPWTPMRSRKLDDGSLQIDCWNRSHWFNGPLPARMRNGDVEQLAAPVMLRIVSNGQTLAWRAASFSNVQTSATKVSFDTTARAGDIDMSAQTHMEFDGLMWTAITLAPRRPTQIDAIDLTIPIDGRYASLKHVPGEVLLTGNTGREDGWTWEYSAKRFFLWLGNEDLGLTWFYERPEQLRFAAAEKFVQLQRRGPAMNFTARYVAKPITLDKPLTLEFGIQATPVRDRPVGWRSWGAPRSIGHSITIPWTTEHIDRYGAGYPEATSPAFYSRFVEHQKRFGKVVPYKILLWHGIHSPEWQYHQADWSLGGGINKYSDTRQFWWGERVCGAAEDYVDFIAWKMLKHIKDYQLDGVYHDLQWSYRCNNQYHGCAPSRRAIRGDRELNKRLYIAMKQLNWSTWKIDHPSASTCSTFGGFCDINVTGEEMCAATKPKQSNYRVWNDYFDAMRISYFKAGGGMGRQWGSVPMFLLQMVGGAPPGATEGIYSILLAHDAIPTWRAHACDVRFENRLWRTLDAFGIGEADVQFLPYWRGATPVKTVQFIPDGNGPIRPVQVLYQTEPFDRLQENESYGVSVYHRPGKRSLAVVFNYTQDDGIARLKIDPSALGLNASRVAATDGFSRLRWVSLGDHLDVRVKRRNFRLVWLAAADTEPGTVLPDEPEEALLAGRRPGTPERQPGVRQQVVGDLWENPWVGGAAPDLPQRTEVAQIFTLDQPASVHRIELHMTDAGARGNGLREALRAQLFKLNGQGLPGDSVVGEDAFVPQEVNTVSGYRHFDLRKSLWLESGRYALVFSKPAEDPLENYHSLLAALPLATAGADNMLIRQLPGGSWESRPHTLAMAVYGYRR